jgi:hypothetical protein
LFPIAVLPIDTFNGRFCTLLYGIKIGLLTQEVFMQKLSNQDRENQMKESKAKQPQEQQSGEVEKLSSEQVKNAQASGDGSLSRSEPSIYNRINDDGATY